MITNQQLRRTFLTPAMKYYFDKKLAPLPSADVDARIEEALKYLNMAFHCNGDIPVSSEIDEIWHYWILQTIQYKELCDKLHGGIFLHHSSNDYAEFEDTNAKNRRIELRFGVAVLSSYVMNYGPFQADRLRYWPLAPRLMQLSRWNIRQLNGWLGAARLQARSESALAAA